MPATLVLLEASLEPSLDLPPQPYAGASLIEGWHVTLRFVSLWALGSMEGRHCLPKNEGSLFLLGPCCALWNIADASLGP